MIDVVLSGLIKKRNILARQEIALLEQQEALNLDIQTLERAIKIFEPEFDLRTLSAKRKYNKNSIFKTGEQSTIVIDVMRKAAKPMNTTEIVNAVARVKEIDMDSIDKKGFRAGIAQALYKLSKSGIFREVSRDKRRLIVWEIVP